MEPVLAILSLFSKAVNIRSSSEMPGMGRTRLLAIAISTA